MTLRALATAACALALAPAPASALNPFLGASSNEALPRPAALEPAVAFWTRIYSQVDTGGGLIHDSTHLDVVYEEIRLPKRLGARASERHVENIKKGYRNILRKLASGRRTGLSPEEERVLRLWPEGVSNATLRAAARDVRFQLGQADKFRAGLARAGAWRDYIEDVLSERGLPEEIAALPHVESSYNPLAYSRVGAAGLWQFTRSTGRRYLRVDHVVDERLDPYKATVAAARLLSENYRNVGTWPLAITAYNHGAAGMRRAVHKLGTDDIAEIVRRYKSRSFGFASRNFYASFLAAVQVDREAERYFGRLDADRPVAHETLTLDHYYTASSLERALGIERESLRRHNPALRPAIWNGSKYLPRGYELRLPRGTLEEAPEALLARIPGSQRFSSQHRDRFYKVRRGDTLSIIARRYGVRMSELVALNNLRSRHRIRAGQVLILPDGAGGGGVTAVAVREEPPADGIYRVRRGDRLALIAQRFGTTEGELARLNRLRDPNRLAVGQKLVLPGAPVAVASIAPAEASGRALAIAASDPPSSGTGAPATPVVVAAIDSLDTPAALPRAAEASAAPEEEIDLAAIEPEEDPDLEAIGPEDDIDLSESETEDEIAESETEDEIDLAVIEPDAAVDAIELAAIGPEAGHPLLPIVPAAVAASAAANPAPDPSNYAVGPDGRVVVHAEETLGHYADWLELPTSRLRQINGMRSSTPLVIGRRVRLDFNRVTPAIFERRRLAYHQDLQAEFFASFSVAGTETYTLSPGDSLWSLARQKFELPVWLLHHYNPDLDFGALEPGSTMVIPIVEPREG